MALAPIEARCTARAPPDGGIVTTLDGGRQFIQRGQGVGAVATLDDRLAIERHGDQPALSTST